MIRPTQMYLIGIILVLAVAAGVWFLWRFLKARLAKAIRNDPNPLAMWTYTPAEWQQAVADEFTWGRAEGNSAQIKICQLGFLVDDGSGARVFQLETGTRVVTFAGYLPIEGSRLKLRVRWRVKRGDKYEHQETRYYKEDYRIPVPLREREQAQNVVDFFTNKLQNNLEAYTALLADDESISLFGNDSF